MHAVMLRGAPSQQGSGVRGSAGHRVDTSACTARYRSNCGLSGGGGGDLGARGSARQINKEAIGGCGAP